MNRLARPLFAALCLAFASAALAQARLNDKAQLVAALSAKPPCCVIDGRNAASRKREVLDNALLWRPDLKINPTAIVVVVADRDEDALGIAKALERKHPGKAILAVKGGVTTWKSASFSLLAASANGSASGLVNFVIPANTCEQGKPLQELRSNRK
jgi:hypothetical protein